MIDDKNQGVTDTGEETPQGDNAAPQTQDPQNPETPEAPTEQSEDEQDADKDETTTRGTKVAKEPESRYYQQLKNENADMRRLLGDPKLLKEYLRDEEGTRAPQDGKEDELDTLVKQATLPDGQVDAHKLARLMDERTTKKIESGMQHLSKNMSKGLTQARAYDEDKMLVRGEHPELDPRRKDIFDPELDQMIGERYLAQGGYEGKITLKQVVDDTFAYFDKLKGKATQAAETEVVRKRTGAIPAQSVPGTAKDDEASMSPEQILAKRVRLAVQGRS